MAKRTPYPKAPAAPRKPAKSRAAPRKPAAVPRPDRTPPVEDPLPSLADLKRARAKLDLAIAALERKRRK